MKTIKKVALAFFENKKMLQVRSKKQSKIFFTLGGKIEEGETDIECLEREIQEEIGCKIDFDSLKFLTEFKDGGLDIKMYTGKIIGDPKANSEIEEIGFFDTNSKKENLSQIAQTQIFPWLKEKELIN